MTIEASARNNCTSTTTPISANGQPNSFDDARSANKERKQQQQHHHPRKRPIKHNTSISSSAPSYGQRDSRLHSIYDQYLYQNNESVDLPLQALHSLTAKRSIRKENTTLDSIEEMSSSSRYQQQQQHQHQQAKAARHHKQAVPSGGRTNRDSHAETSPWAGLMTGNVADDSDSDLSDDERVRVPTPKARGQQAAPASSAAPGSRTSWSSRAAAVGSRPPDSASQNPPTLKLLGLKSVKEGGTPIAPPASSSTYSSRHASSRQYEEESRSRIVSTSDYGDELDRHDSFIEEFDGARNQPFSNEISNANADRAYPNSSSLHPPSGENRPVSPRTALTQQLGLVTPQPTQHNQGPAPQQNGQERGRKQQPDGYFPPMISPSSSGDSSSNMSQPRSLVANRAQPGQQQQRHQQQRAPPPPALAIPNASQIIPLQRNQLSPVYPPSSPGFAPLPSPSASTPPSGGGEPAPMPIPLPSPIYAPNPAMRQHNGQYSQGGIDRSRGAAAPPGPGFSDTPQAGGRQNMRRQPSLLRRSMAFITGSGPMPPTNQQQYPQQAGAQPRQGNQGNPQGRNLFRRSMAFFSGRPMPAMMPEPQPAQPVDKHDDASAPQPRVAGFVDEKPRNRKSEYLGGGAVGDEWDYAGVGAKFWKRFSMAQRKELEGANKDSEQFRRRTEKRRRWIMYMSLLGGVCIIGAVIGIVIWRENVNTSDTPGALDRGHNGVYTVVGSTKTDNGGANVNAVASATSSVSSRATSTSRRHRSTANRRRDIGLATASPIARDIIRDLASGAPAYYGGVHPLPRDHQLKNARSLRRRKRLAQTTPAPMP